MTQTKIKPAPLNKYCESVLALYKTMVIELEETGVSSNAAAIAASNLIVAAHIRDISYEGIPEHA